MLLRYAAAAPVFAAIAALQWPGVLRWVTATVLVAVGAVVVVPRWQDSIAEDRNEKIALEIGTTARPWVTEIEGLEGLAPRATGSEYLWTDYVVEDEPAPVVSLLRMPDADAMGGDPCRGMFHTPEGTFDSTTCATADGSHVGRDVRRTPGGSSCAGSTGPGSARQPGRTCRSASSRRRSGMRDR